MRHLLIYILIPALFAVILPNELIGQCNATFTFQISGPTITLTNTSTNSTKYSWDYGDNSYSIASTNVHAKTFRRSGTYNICLTAEDNGGCKSTKCSTVVITASAVLCEASFNNYMIPPTLTTTNTSINNATNAWTFGDGSTSTASSPSHTYFAPGTYNVCLAIENTAKTCKDTVCRSVVVSGGAGLQCASDFTFSVNNNQVSFFNNSTNNASDKWYFGDGGGATSSNPIHNYTQAGTYNVCLVIEDSNRFCKDSTCKTVVVTSSTPPCQAAFTSTVNGSVVTLSNTSTGTGNNTTYSWDMGNGATLTGQNPANYTYPAAGTYRVCLTITDANINCNSTFCDTIIISNAPPPACQAGFTHTTNSLTATFANTSTGGGANTTYAWNFGDGATSSTMHTSHTYTQGGSYQVCLIMTDQAKNCADTICQSITVTVTPTCQAQFIHSSANLTAFFTNTSTGAGTNTTYKWDFGDGNTSNSTSPTHTYGQAGTYQVCLIMADPGNNCADTLCQSVSVLGQFNCLASYTMSRNGLTASFTNTSIGGGANTTYKWDFGDGSNSNQINPSHTYGQAGTYQVCLIMADQTTNCNDTICHSVVVSNTISCTAAFAITRDPNNDNDLDFTDNSTPQSTYTYQWTFSDGQNFTSKNVNRIFNNPGNYNVCLEINDLGNLCKDSSCQNFTIIGTLPCKAEFTSAINDKTVTLTNQSSHNTHVTYSWNFGDGSAGSSDLNPVHTYTSYGTYSICLTMVDTITSCWNKYCETIIVNAPCISDFDAVDDGNGSFQFKNQSSPIAQLDVFSWTFGDGNNANTQDASHQYNTPGSYEVCLTVEGTQRGCSDKSCQTVAVNWFSVEEHQLSDAIQIYPNPFEEKITLSWKKTMDFVTVRVVDIIGNETLIKHHVEAIAGSDYVLDLSSHSLSSGVYYLEITTRSGKSTYPIYKR